MSNYNLNTTDYKILNIQETHNTQAPPPIAEDSEYNNTAIIKEHLLQLHPAESVVVPSDLSIHQRIEQHYQEHIASHSERTTLKEMGKSCTSAFKRERPYTPPPPISRSES